MKISGKSMEILLILASDPDREYSGYEIGKQLSMPSGTLYPLLLKIEQAGLLTTKWEDGDPKILGRPRRRYHKISGQGVRSLQNHMRKFDIKDQGESGIFGVRDMGEVGT